jgi:carbon monoxide dehydrogenase subunit G
VQVRGSITVVCTPEATFAFMAEPANDRLWRSHLVSSHGSITRVGDQVVQTYAYQGKSKSVTLEVAEYDPPARLSYVIREQVRIRITFHITAEDSGSRVSMSASTNLSGPAALFEGRLQAEVDKLIHTDLRRLKTAVETVGEC